MRVTTYVDGRELAARLHLSLEEKIVLRRESNLRCKVVLDRTPRNYEQFDNTWVTTVDDFLGQDVVIECQDFSQAKRYEEDIAKRIAQLTKEIFSYIPEPEPEPEAEPIAPDIPGDLWFEHCLLLAPTGAGKSTALSWRMSKVMRDVAEGRASLILMEPKSDLLDAFLKTRLVWKLRDRVVYINPEDAEHPVGVNVFSRGTGTERDVNDAVSMVNYLLAATTADLTFGQRPVVESVTQLLFELPGNPTMRDFIEIIRDGLKPEHFSSLENLTDTAAKYLRRNMMGSDPRGRRGEVLTRLESLLLRRDFQRLLMPDSTTLNMLDVMQEGSIILINANSDYLGMGEYTEFYAKFWIAQIYRSALGRFRLKREGVPLTPTWLFIDEAQFYISNDELFGQILNTARGAQIGTLVAAHFFRQIDNPKVRDALDINCRIRFEAIENTDYLFQCSSRAYNGPVKFPPTFFGEWPQSSREQLDQVIERSRERFTYQPTRRAPPTPEPVDQPEPEPPPEEPPPRPPRRGPTKW